MYIIYTKKDFKAWKIWNNDIYVNMNDPYVSFKN